MDVGQKKILLVLTFNFPLDILTYFYWKTNIKDCKDLEVDPEEKYCCYVVLEDGTKECYPATEDDVEDLNNFQDELEQTYYKMEITTLKCQSNYLQFYVLSLLLILFIS